MNGDEHYLGLELEPAISSVCRVLIRGGKSLGNGVGVWKFQGAAGPQPRSR